MSTIKVTRYKRTGGWFLDQQHIGEYVPKTMKEHDDLIIKLLDQYHDQPDVKIYRSSNVVYKEVDALLAWRPEHPKDQLIFDLVCPTSDIKTWRAVQCYHDMWYYLTRTWGYDGFNDGFYLSWGAKKLEFAPSKENCRDGGWLYNYHIDALLKEAREKHQKDLRRIPLHLWKKIPHTWQQGLQVCDTW